MEEAMIGAINKKRDPVVPLNEHETKLDVLSLSLRNTIDENPLTIEGLSSMSTIIRKAKDQWKLYHDSSTALIERYIKIGSFEEAQIKREEKSEMRSEVRQFINIANSVLREDNMDSISNVSSVSLRRATETHEPPPTLFRRLGDAFDPLIEPPVDLSDFSAGRVPGARISSKADVCSKSDAFSGSGGFFTAAQLPFNTSVHSALPSRSICDTMGIPTSNSNFAKTSEQRVKFETSSRFMNNATSHPQNNSGPDLRPTLEPSFGGFLQPAANKSMDPATLYLIKQELFKPSATPYDGDPRGFRSWVMLLENRMRGVTLDPLDVITILLANTKGESHKIIQDYLSSGAANPDRTLQNIWNVLYKEYGAPVKVCNAIQKKLADVPIIRPPFLTTKLKELIHVCHMIEANMATNQELQIFNLTAGQKQVWCKLPDWLQRKWRSRGYKFGLENMGSLPPFQNLVDFLQYNLDEMMNPNFEVAAVPREIKRTLATAVESELPEYSGPVPTCIYHNKPGHSLSSCHSFAKLQYSERAKFVFDNKLCYRCTGKHLARDCTTKSKCARCHRDHITAMHSDKPIRQGNNSRETIIHQKSDHPNNVEPQKTLCSVVCGNPGRALSCSKTVLCEVHHESRPNKVMRLYAVIDDCSDSSYISERVINQLQLSGVETSYLLSTMESLRSEHRAVVVDGLWIRGVNRDKYYSLPELYSSKFIPGSVYEVGTPDIIKSIPNLSHFSNRFLDLDPNCEPLLLLGRNAGNLMKCSYTGNQAPFICETPLGYCLIGSPCPEVRSHEPPVKTVLHTSHEHYTSKALFPETNPLYSKIFHENYDDESPGLSREDQKFLDIVENTIHVNNTGHITISLPFKSDNVCMPNNRTAVYHRTRSTLLKLRGDSEKLQQCVRAMGKDIASGHIERVPDDEQSPLPGRAWWLPIFAVTHPRKKKHRLVYDSSAKYHGVSLNQELLQGPDENNKLKGVLMRFRLGEVAFGGDIESMFYNFHLPSQDRNFLRFFWFDKNNPTEEIVEYRGRVHLFGNKPSPAIAGAGLKYATCHPNAQLHPEAVRYITENIYVDDLLAACRSVDDAVRNLKTIRDIFEQYHIRLCKIISNRPEVMHQFQESERANLEAEVNIGSESIHRALGVAWQTQDDNLIIKTEPQKKPLTRRGILSVTNSVFDPLGMVSPVVLSSKLVQRKALQNDSGQSCNWDEALPGNIAKEWLRWLHSLSALNDIVMPRSYIPDKFGVVTSYELHTFTDASESAIGAVVYLRIFSDRNEIYVSFVTSASKLTPKTSTSIPRSELCAALLGCNLRREVEIELQVPIDKHCMYSDSMVVISYLRNTEKRFSKYVSHRVDKILKLTNVLQWSYINTSLNPADIACWPQTPRSLAESVWFRGPDFLWTEDVDRCRPCPDLVADLPEVVRETVTLKVDMQCRSPLEHVSSSVSTLNKAIRVVVVILRFCRKILWRSYSRSPNLECFNATKQTAVRGLIIAAQRTSYGQLTETLRRGRAVPNNLASFDPFVDADGMIRVGGRLKDSSISYTVKHPILLSHQHPLSTLITRHFHASTQHQGRHLTLGAVRSAGYFVEKGSRLVRQIVERCVFCRKLRSQPLEQLMAPLPGSRVEETPPFHHTGIDVFGHFTVTDGKATRQTRGNKKIWALIATCMASRAIHVEPLQGLDVSSLANALRRFIAIRGACRHIYSDRGTNFVGMSNQKDASALLDVQEAMKSRDITWHFNPPHASHFGGAWERKIGALRRVFEGTLIQLGNRMLSRDEFCTLLLEAMAIVNNTPMWEISTDPKDPLPISPAMLLTMRDSTNPQDPDCYTPSDLNSYGPKRWRRTQFLAETFWQKWRTFYLSGLQERSKWIRRRRSVREGDVVLLVNKNEKRNSWPLAVVRKTKISSDGLVRSVTVQAASISSSGSSRVFERPISAVILLVPSETESSDQTDGDEVSGSL